MSDDGTPAKVRLTDGLGPVGWRYVPSEVWGDQVLTQDPKAAQLAREYGRDVEPLFTEAQMLARVAAERERCAKLCEREAQAWRDVMEPDVAAGVDAVADVLRRGDEAYKQRRT